MQRVISNKKIFINIKILFHMKTKTLLLAVFACLFSTCLFSQEKGKLIYTDFEPDSTIFPVWFAGNPIDINYDGVKDFVFRRESKNGWGILDANYEEDWNRMIVKLQPNTQTPLHYVGPWKYEYTLLPYGDYCFGFRYMNGDNSYCYGWMRIRVDNTVNNDHIPSVTIYDMAYCTIPNYPLKFGQKSLTEDVAKISAANYYSLYPNPADDRLVLKLADEHKCENVSVYSIDGRMLKSQDSDFDNIDVSALTRGVYFVRIRLQEGSVFTEKIVIK